MCGRYAASKNADQLVEEFEVDLVSAPYPLPPDFYVAPTKDVYAVLARRSRTPDGAPGVGVQRRLTVARWGLVPSWAKDPGIGARMINARVETLTERPAYKSAFARRRCILPADGYYEWYPTARRGRSGKPLKQPFFIRPGDGSTLAMVGLYEIWRNRSVPDDASGAFLW
ncbi:MAG: SOS response-associated peptidase, partial [Sciscionella sp.]